ncbi:MAG TPA: FtsK/SpoIIIE domain-containing protein, partial [Ktedonobacterales bacterium]
MTLGAVSRIVSIHRGPRQWPHLSSETVTIPTVNAPTQSSNTSLIVSLTSLVGLIVSAVVYSRTASSGSGALIIGFLAISGLTMLGSLITYLVQRSSARRQATQLARLYARRLRDIDQSLAELASLESQSRQENDPPLPTLLEQLRQQPGVIWQRRPTDPDFLAVRVGTGLDAPHFRVEMGARSTDVTLPPADKRFQRLQAEGAKLVEAYQLLRDVPATVSLIDHSVVALVNSQPEASRAAATAKVIVSQIAFHHSPGDVQIIIFAPPRRYDEWSWAATLPYASSGLKSMGITPDDREQALSLLLAELVRRQSAARTESVYEKERRSPLPHLVVVVDTFSESDLPQGSAILSAPAIGLALNQGRELGVSVIAVAQSRAQAPAQATLMIETQFSSAQITQLVPDPTEPRQVSQLDTYAADHFEQLGQYLRFYRPEAEGGLMMPPQVALLPMLTPAVTDIGHYDIAQHWAEAPQAQASQRRKGKVGAVIPIGQKLGQETILLDFVNDGPHGLLIGQTGSGKSELLRSLVAALAVQYDPDTVNFVLVDYKAGLALESFEHLPHTVAFLTNMSQAGQTSRFLKMLEAEIIRRQRARETGKTLPRLFVIIDEFAEMVSRKGDSDNTDTIIENLLSIVRLGRELDTHLLFASQRPEGNIIQRLRGYVQYRICLRTNSPDDSREVLGVPDAAELPAGIPGRGYILRGDNELQLFQAARVAIPYDKDPVVVGRKRRTMDRVLAERMGEYRSTYAITPWPRSLPTPGFDNPTPLVLVKDATASTGTAAWDPALGAGLRTMEVPLGLFDRPTAQHQGWWAADFIGHDGRLNGGPLLIMGDLNSGKTTALQTLLVYLAGAYGPRQLRWFIVDPSSSLAEFARLPQAADPRNPSAINITDGLDTAEFNAFRERFEQAAQMPVGAGGRPPVLLVIDDYDELASRFGEQLKTMAQRAIKSRGQQVYLALAGSRPGFNGVPQDIIAMMPLRVLLYMSDKDQLRTVLGGRLPFV